MDAKYRIAGIVFTAASFKTRIVHYLSVRIALLWCKRRRTTYVACCMTSLTCTTYCSIH